MRPRFAGTWISAVLAALGMTMVGGGAEAGSVVGAPSPTGIQVTGGVTQGGDPQYTYYLDIYLVDDTIPAYESPGPAVATVSATGITGISSADTYNYSSPYGSPPVLIGSPTIGTGTVDIDFFNSASISTTGTALLLQLTIITPANTPSGLNPGDQFTYTFTIGSLSGGGTVILTDGPPPLVPEPSSLVLMLVGGTALPYLGLRHRRCRRSRGVA